MKVKRALKYVLFLLTVVGLGFLYSFSSARNQQKKVSEIIVEFEEGENQFLSHPMVETVNKIMKSILCRNHLATAVVVN
mgnify:CR=1 FL=1